MRTQIVGPGRTITDPESHERGTICFTPLASTEVCKCPNAKWFTDEEAHQQPKEVRGRLTLRAHKVITLKD